MFEIIHNGTKAFTDDYEYAEILKSGSVHIVPKQKATHIYANQNIYPISEVAIICQNATELNGVYEDMAKLVETIYQNDMKYIVGE